MGKLLSHIDEEFTIEVCNIFSKINEDDILYKKISSEEYLSELYNYLDTIEIKTEYWSFENFSYNMGAFWLRRG